MIHDWPRIEKRKLNFREGGSGAWPSFRLDIHGESNPGGQVWQTFYFVAPYLLLKFAISGTRLISRFNDKNSCKGLVFSYHGKISALGMRLTH